MSLYSELLGDCSPYIFNLVYDIDARMLFIECLDDPEGEEPDLRLVFPEVVRYQEQNQLTKPDDETMDDVVDIIREDHRTIRILTYKKAIDIELTGEPFVEKID